MARNRWDLLIASLLLVGLAWIWVNRVPSDEAGATEPAAVALPSAPVVGHPAPDFSLETLSGEELTLSRLRGTPVVLNFWATWCPPCRAELPELAAASARLAGQVAIIGVNQAEARADVATYMSATFASGPSLPFPVPLDERADVSRTYRVRSLPTTFFIDRQGIVRQVQIGPVTEATLAQLLKTIYP